MAGYWPTAVVLFFYMSINLDSVVVYKHTKEELGQYQVVSTVHLVNNPYIYNHYQLVVNIYS